MSTAATADGLASLTRALLAAGAHCVLVALWPVPNTAVQVRQCLLESLVTITVLTL